MQPNKTAEVVATGKEKQWERLWNRGLAVEPAVSSPPGYQNKLEQAKREILLGWLCWSMFASLVISICSNYAWENPSYYLGVDVT